VNDTKLKLQAPSFKLQAGPRGPAGVGEGVALRIAALAWFYVAVRA
jgi:hypothetical protein